MKELPEEVWNDLITLYHAGEASASTRTLLEEQARRNPEFAEKLGRMAKIELPPPPADLPQDGEMRTLRMTRQFIFLRTLFSAMGIAFSFAPFAFAFRNHEWIFFMWRDAPGVAHGFLSLAVASWIACYVMHRRIHKSGL